MPNEPERYELFEAPPYQFHLNRRDFLEVAGFVICLTATPLLNAQTAAKPLARLAFAADGTVTVYSGKVDMGQGAATELAMAVAEELRLPLSKVRAVLGDTDLCPNDGITAGSRTTPATVPEARKAAAAHRGGELTPPANWTTLGKPHPALNGRAIVTGQHEYPSDPPPRYALRPRPPAPQLRSQAHLSRSRLLQRQDHHSSQRQRLRRRRRAHLFRRPPSRRHPRVRRPLGNQAPPR